MVVHVDLQLIMSSSFFMFTALSREVIARFIELDGIADHH
jgi:hypothetical protein